MTMHQMVCTQMFVPATETEYSLEAEFVCADDGWDRSMTWPIFVDDHEFYGPDHLVGYYGSYVANQIVAALGTAVDDSNWIRLEG